MLDVDHFKELNDEHGHEAGDRCWPASPTAVRERLRAEDQVGRLGGEEFLALLPDAGRRGRGDRGRGPARERRARATQAGLLASPSASAGRRGRREDADALLERADKALFVAKAAGPRRRAGSGEPRSASLRRR